jgi:organic radical activating enzyme
VAEIAWVAPARLQPVYGGCVVPRGDEVVVITPPQPYAYCAEVKLELPDITVAHIVKVRIRVEIGTIGVGWLRQDEIDWVARASSSSPNSTELDLPLPAGTQNGKLVFDNWTAGGNPGVGVVESIAIVGAGENASSADAHFRLALAHEECGNRDQAISHYKASLRIDPSHVEAIAGLGRLRFREPDRPFMNEINRRAPVDVCEIHIQVRNPCNYRCFYCVAKGSNNLPVQHLDLNRIKQAYSQINAKLIVTSFECGGGEPTVHPQFSELLRLCASYGPVSFPTNNSQNPRRWLAPETARRISLRAALHPEGEPKIDRYIDYAKFLVDAGVNFVTQYIAHPTRMSNIPRYEELFGQHQIPFSPIAFIGEYQGKLYPYSYTEEEKERLGLKAEVRYWADKIGPHINRIRNFRGIPCIAGARQIYVMSDGTLRRCLYDLDRVLDKPLRRSEPCGVGNCGCGIFLDKLNATETVEFHNYFGAHVGLEPIATEWMDAFARTLGYPGRQEAMAAEGIKMYDALMTAYGKDEFR